MSVERPLIRDMINGTLNSRIETTQFFAGFNNFGLSLAEQTAGVTPTDYSFPPGDVRRYGAISGQDCADAINTSLAVNNIAEIPENFRALLSKPIDCVQAGSILRGRSRFTSIIAPLNASYTFGMLVRFPSAASSTYYGLTVTDLFFEIFSGSTALDIIGVDLSSCNNSTVTRCRFYGVSGAALTRLGVGVLYNAPLSIAAYSNVVEDCDMTYLRRGVLYGSGANNNTVSRGEIIACAIAIDAAPGSVVDHVRVIDTRIEACDRGILEGSEVPHYEGVRFENQAVCDIEFTANSSSPLVVGCSTATTPLTLKNLNLAVGSPMVLSPDMRGIYSRMASASFQNEFIGPNVMAPLGNTGTLNSPTGISDVALYGRGGKVVLDNNNAYFGRNAAGTAGVELIKANTGDRVEIDSGGNGIRLGGALTALGGGAAATLGTIGGGGPGTAAQNTWKLLFDSGGNAFWVPCWK